MAKVIACWSEMNGLDLLKQFNILEIKNFNLFMKIPIKFGFLELRLLNNFKIFFHATQNMYFCSKNIKNSIKNQ